MEFRVPFATLMKIVLAILLIVVVVKLWSVILMLIIAVLIAVMLDPVVVWLERHGARKGLAIGLIAVLVFGLLIVFLGFVIPSVSKQLVEMSKELPQIVRRLTASNPVLASIVPQKPMQGMFGRGLAAGMLAVEGLTAVIFVLVVAMYLLVEGRRAYAWLVSFAPARNRKKCDRTAREMNGVVLAYMRGNVITSFVCAGFVFGVMSLLRVPMPLLLATIAFVADFVPVVGTIAMIVPAALLALMVSPVRALLVVVAILFYHLIENYVIVPRVYGTQMRLSTLTVLVAIAIGGTLQGVIGAVLALPVAAAYPIVEDIWLREVLPSDTVPRHEAIEGRDEES